MAKKQAVPYLSESDDDADWLKKLDGGRHQKKDLAASDAAIQEAKKKKDAQTS